jgi:AAA+ superfamily predicted ATPase
MWLLRAILAAPLAKRGSDQAPHTIESRDRAAHHAGLAFYETHMNLVTHDLATVQSVNAQNQMYLGSLLNWLRELLNWHIALTQQTFGTLADDSYRGLYVPDAEIEILGAVSAPMSPQLALRRAELAEERAALELHAAALEREGSEIPLLKLARTFGFSSFERDVLLLALAPELDLRYERLFAYIQDDVTKKRPSVNLALVLLCATPEDRIAARAAFAPDSPLIHHRIIQLFEDGQRQPPLLARFIKLDDRIVTALLNQPTVDPLLESMVKLSRPRRSLAQMILPTDLRNRLRQAMIEHMDGLILALQGSYGSGRRAIAEALCAEAQIPLLAVNLERLVAADLDPEETTQRVLREAMINDAAILWLGGDRVLREETLSAWQTALLSAMDSYRGCSFLPLDQGWEARGAIQHNWFLRIEIPTLAYGEREQIWRSRLNGDSPDTGTLQALASTFRLSGGQIRDAVTMARSLARWHGGPLSREDFYVACRAQSSGKLDSMAHKIKTTYDWDDIVLPPDQLSQLREISAQVRHRQTVLERWGFDRHLAMGKGVNTLFAGPSGTGKTMSAEIIAYDLGLELYKIDLSTVVSKYIGETEKNLDRIFTAAREANAILFFDEADALFGKRSEVKDAHDRYANIEVGYLLQKMEEYDGVVILATNLRKNMDDAFVRRLHVAIDFPFPEEPDRLRIWQKAFPPEAPLASDVDLPFLAKQFKLAGGNIRNIALLSAFLAAEANTSIEMIHLVRSIKREYQKMGKLVTETDFGRYMPLIRG